MKRFFSCFITVILFVSSYTGFAQKDTLRVLFAGNSYTYYNNLPKMVSEFSKSTSTFIQAEMSTVGGARLKYHYTQEHGLKTKDLIKNGNFDIVVLQEQSMGTLTNKDEFLLYAKKLSNYIKQHGAKPYFFATWSRERTPLTQNTITTAYKKAASASKGKAILVGDIWGKAIKRHPKLDLYIEDGSHPTLLGTFFTACVFVKTLTGQLPSKTNTPTTKRLDLNDLQLCLQIVQSTDVR